MSRGGTREGAGPPLKLTPEIEERICNLLRSGCYRETACAACGIGSNTLRDWLRRGAAGEEPFATFSEHLEIVESESEIRDIAAINEAGKLDWKARAWIRERRSPKRWGQKQAIEHSGAIGSESVAQQAALASRLMHQHFGKVTPPADDQTRPPEPERDPDT